MKLTARSRETRDAIAQQADQGEEDFETRKQKPGNIPRSPTQKDLEEHLPLHIQFRDWCPICVQARSVSDPHFSGVDRSDRTVPAVCADYCFMSRDPQLKAQLKVLTGKRFGGLGGWCPLLLQNTTVFCTKFFAPLAFCTFVARRGGRVGGGGQRVPAAAV